MRLSSRAETPARSCFHPAICKGRTRSRGWVPFTAWAAGVPRWAGASTVHSLGSGHHRQSGSMMWTSASRLLSAWTATCWGAGVIHPQAGAAGLEGPRKGRHGAHAEYTMCPLAKRERKDDGMAGLRPASLVFVSCLLICSPYGHGQVT